MDLSLSKLRELVIDSEAWLAAIHGVVNCWTRVSNWTELNWTELKESSCNAGHLGLNPGFVRSPGEAKGYPLQYSALEKSMDCIVLWVTKSWTWLSNLLIYYLSTSWLCGKHLNLPINLRLMLNFISSDSHIYMPSCILMGKKSIIGDKLVKCITTLLTFHLIKC